MYIFPKHFNKFERLYDTDKFLLLNVNTLFCPYKYNVTCSQRSEKKKTFIVHENDYLTRYQLVKQKRKFFDTFNCK